MLDTGFSYENTKLNSWLLPSNNLLSKNIHTQIIVIQIMYADVCWEHGTGHLYFFK